MLNHISLYLHIRDISLQYVTAQKELNINKTKEKAYRTLPCTTKHCFINTVCHDRSVAIGMGIPVMPELTSHWLIDFYQYRQKNPAIKENGERMEKCGISDALANDVP